MPTGRRVRQLHDLLDDPERARETMWMDPPEAMEYEKVTPGDRWHKGDVIHNNRVRLELFRRFGVLPGSGDHHVAEFFPGFVTPENDYGSEWKVHIYGLRKHMADADDDVTHYEAVRDRDEVSRFPSGELVAPLLEALITGTRRDLPVNLPNRGQVTNLPDGLVVEAMGTIDADGVRAATRWRCRRCWASTCAGSRCRRSSPSTPRSPAIARRCSRRCSPTRWPGACPTKRSPP